MRRYGIELIIDMHNCSFMPNAEQLEQFCNELCDEVDMNAEDFHIWESNEDDERNPKLWGVSCVQFITTSNITIHTLPLLHGGSVYLNLFTCKAFDTGNAVRFIRDWFGAEDCSSQIINRV